jgi:hypothetical protein
MHKIYTLSSTAGDDYLSRHPEGGHVAHLYHSHELADEAISEMGNPHEWQIKEVADLSDWLEECKSLGITHICESKPGDINNMHQIHNFEIFANSSGGRKSLEE